MAAWCHDGSSLKQQGSAKAVIEQKALEEGLTLT